MAPARLALTTLAVVGAVAVALASSGADAAAHTAGGCRVLAAPSSLGATLLRLHRTYMLHQPDVHKPTITGPVGRVYLGVCGTERYALADFDATYNNLKFGTEDQPERFVKPANGAWRDIGNTGGPPCGSAPLHLLEAWKIVHSCPK